MRVLSLGLLLGVIMAFEVSRLPPLWVVSALLVAVPLAFHPRAGFRLGAGVVIGMLWAWWYAASILNPTLDPTLEGQDLVLDGRIVGLIEERRHSIRFLFEPLDAAPGVPERIRLNWYRSDIRPVPGEHWRFTLRLKRPNGFQNPGGFDYEGWLFQQHVGATGYVRSKGETLRLDRGFCGLDCLRSALRDRILEAADDCTHLGILLALAIGDRSHIDAARWDVLLRTGTNHLVAISGLHIGLVGGLVFWLARRAVARVPSLCRHAPATRWAAVAGLLAATVYAALAGFTVPTQRALVMLAVPFGAILLGRQLRVSTALALALVAVLTIDPTAARSGGFWLSFGAVAVLLFGFAGRLEGRSRLGGWVRAQYLLGLGLLPLTTFWFQRAALAAPLANLIAVPWVSLLIVPLVLLATLASVIHPALGGALYDLASLLFTPLWWCLERLAAQPALVWTRASPEPLLLGLAGLGLLWLLMPRGVPGRALGLFLLLPLALPVSERVPGGEAEVTLLDVGQGLAAVVRTERHTLLFDAGPRFSPEFDTGEAVVLPFLRHRGVERIDRFIVSHGDNDHVGGAQSVLAGIPVEGLLVSDPTRGDWDRPVSACRDGQHWHWDGVDFEILHPSPAYRGSENNGSCVLRVRVGEHAVLFSGDIEAEGEWALVHAYGQQIESEVLIVPHHGSNTSSSDYFLDAVTPRLALVSSGYRNRFGFPKPAVLRRYQSRGVPVFDTARSGALSFRLNSLEFGPVEEYRKQTQRLWNRAPGL